MVRVAPSWFGAGGCGSFCGRRIRLSIGPGGIGLPGNIIQKLLDERGDVLLGGFATSLKIVDALDGIPELLEYGCAGPAIAFVGCGWIRGLLSRRLIVVRYGNTSKADVERIADHLSKGNVALFRALTKPFDDGGFKLDLDVGQFVSMEGVVAGRDIHGVRPDGGTGYGVGKVVVWGRSCTAYTGLSPVSEARRISVVWRWRC